MATIVFQAAGAALGGIFGPLGAVIGRAAGALAGNAIDRTLLSNGRTVTGARLSTARIPGADEGAAINRLYGAARIGGTLIWATRFEESLEVQRRGGKGNRGPKVETFRYFASFAIGLCEGEAARVRRVWADGREMDLSAVEMRFYPGSETQLPDPLIEAKQGRAMRRPFADWPMWCSNACRSTGSATAFRSCSSKWCGRSAGWKNPSAPSPSFRGQRNMVTPPRRFPKERG